MKRLFIIALIPLLIGATCRRQPEPPVQIRAITHFGGNSGSNDASGTTLGVTVNSVPAAALVVIWIKWEGAATTVSISDGTSSLSGATQLNHSNGDLNGQFFYLLSANSGNRTYTATWSASRPFRRMIVSVFNIDGGETVTLDAQNGQELATFDPLNSGNINTTGTDEVVVGAYGEYSATNTSNEQINGVAATQNAYQTIDFTSTWYRILTATFTDGAATATSGDEQEICAIVAFKSETAAAGGSTFPPQIIKRNEKNDTAIFASR